MQRSDTEDTQLDMLTAAFLTGEGEKQIDIARMLNKSQAAVSRLLAEARKKYLREEIRFLRELVPKEIMDRIAQRVSRNSLATRLDRISLRFSGSRGPVLRSFACAPSGRDTERMTELSRRAAPCIRELILRCRCVGVAWGGMLARVVSAQRALSIAPPWRESDIDVIPLVGEPLGDSPTAYSSSNIAHDLGVVINGESYNARSLAMVPAFLPDGFRGPEIAGIWRMIDLVKSHVEIYGPRNASPPPADALATRLQMVLTSVGPAEYPLGMGVGRGRLYETGNVSIEELRDIVKGDVSGVCLPREGLSKPQKAKLAALAARWTGPTLEHLRSCSGRAAEHPDPFAGPPGVVVICVRPARAPIILAAVKLGLINHLIIDDELQDELDRLSKAVPLVGLG